MPAQAVRQSADQVRMQLGLPAEPVPAGDATTGSGDDPTSAAGRASTATAGSESPSARSGRHYLVCQALRAEPSAILKKLPATHESLGFTRDLPAYIRAASPYVVDGGRGSSRTREA